MLVTFPEELRKTAESVGVFSAQSVVWTACGTFKNEGKTCNSTSKNVLENER